MRDFILGSEWRFLPDGLVDLKNRYEAKLKAENLSGTFYWYPETYCFGVRCPDEGEFKYDAPRDSVSARSQVSKDTQARVLFDPPRSCNLFQECVMEIINEELGDTGKYGGLFDEYGSIKSSKVAQIEAKDPKAELPTQEVEWPRETRFCKHKMVWKATNGLELKNILSRADFEALIELSNTTLVTDPEDSQRIFIGSDEEEHVHLTIYTLDNMLKHAIAKAMHARNTELFYAEDRKKFQVNLQLFPHVGNDLSQTTMFPHTPGNHYPRIDNCFTVRLCLYHPIRCRYIPANLDTVIPLSDKAEVSEEHEKWKLYKYAAKDDTIDSITYVPDIPEDIGGPEPVRAGGQGDALLMMEEPTHHEKSIEIGEWAIDLPLELSEIERNSEEDSRLHDTIFNTPKPIFYTRQSQLPAAQAYQPSSSSRQPQVASRVSEPVQTANESSQWPPLPKAAPPAPRKSIQKQPPYQQPAQNRPAHQQPAQQPARQPPAPQNSIQKQPPPHQATQYNQVAAQSCGGPSPSNLVNHWPSPQPRVQGNSRRHPLRSSRGWNGRPRRGGSSSTINRNQSASSNHPVQGNPQQLNATRPSPAGGPVTARNATSSNTTVPLASQPVPQPNTPSEDPTQLDENFFSPRCQTGTLLCEDIPYSFNASVLQPLKLNSPSSGAVEIEKSDEKIAESDETSSRSFHSTMRQKASRRDPSVSNPNASKQRPTDVKTSEKDLTDDFVKSLNVQLVDTFQIMRTCRGRVSLKVEFGRHVISKVQKSMRGSVETPNIRSIQDMGAFLTRPELRPDGPAPATYFSPILTTLPSDMRHLVELKDDGAPMWGNSQSWTVTYNFECLDANDCRFLIEMDAESFKYEVRTLPEVISDINVHCVARLWDFRFRAVASEVHRGAEDFAAELFKTLHVKKDQVHPRMSFETAQKHQISIEKIHVRRSCFHEAPTTILEVAEVQTLKVQFVLHDERRTRITRAWFAAPQASRIQNQPYWFEASASSKVVVNTFQENEKLGLGEETRWQTKDLMIQDVGKDLCAVASTITKQIDGMGFYNDNGEKPRNRSMAQSGAAPLRKSVW